MFVYNDGRTVKKPSYSLKLPGNPILFMGFISS